MTRLEKALMMTLMALSAPTFGGVEAIQNLQKPESGRAAVFNFGGDQGSEFMLDGKPFQIRSGEIHPQRIPREHWQHRIRAAKAMGLNTIAFYVFWNGVEQKDGSWNFEGINDIAAFIDLCQQEGMWVLFRPGPYVCGEWDLGGLPTYLLKDGPTILRSTRNPDFMAAQERYLEEMAKIVIPRLCTKGGPVLMIQLENEYGSYRSGNCTLDYIKYLRDFWTSKGASTFYLSEGGSMQHLRFTLPGVAIGLDPADNERQTHNARKVVKNAPVFSSETYPGWLRHWGEGNWLATDKSKTITWYMQSGFSFNLFMLHGGTSFGLTAGANCDHNDGSQFQPDLTSYDYGSPIGEHGNLTKEYHKYREIITKALPAHAQVPEVPATPPSMALPEFTPQLVCNLNALQMTAAGTSEHPRTLESQGQNQGIAVYTAQVPAGEAAQLQVNVRDYAQIYLNDTHIGDIDRRLDTKSIELPKRDQAQRLTIVLDTFGHINFNKFMERDVKGLIGEVKLGDTPITGWQMDLLPLDENIPAPAPAATGMASVKGGLYRATVTLDKVQDTFLDMVKWPKGYVWVNGHLLGRYWYIGPQERLYCPASFLKQGENTIVVLDTMATHAHPISGKEERNMKVHKVTESLNNQW